MSYVLNSLPIALVTGATGAQGGSVARALLASRQWTVRAMTRHPDSPAARRLAAAGAQIVFADLGDPNSLAPAFHGAHAVYGVTNYWEHFAAEYAQGRHLLEAVAASHARHFVFSPAASARFVSDGRHSVPEYDIKGQLEMDAQAMGLPMTSVHIASYYENFLTFMRPTLQPNGQYALDLPLGNALYAAVSVDDVGPVVAKIFANPTAFMHASVHIVGEEQPMSAYVDAMAQATGTTIAYRAISRDEYATRGTVAAEARANLFDYLRRYAATRAGRLAISKALYPGIERFAPWILRRARTQGVTLAA